MFAVLKMASDVTPLEFSFVGIPISLPDRFARHPQTILSSSAILLVGPVSGLNVFA
jgi:hypothetical protein